MTEKQILFNLLPYSVDIMEIKKTTIGVATIIAVLTILLFGCDKGDRSEQQGNQSARKAASTISAEDPDQTAEKPTAPEPEEVDEPEDTAPKVVDSTKPSAPAFIDPGTRIEEAGERMGLMGLEKAKAWLLQNGDSELGLFAIAKGLTLRERAAAEAWIESIPEGRRKDAALGGMAAAMALNSNLEIEEAKKVIPDLEEGVGRERAMPPIVQRMTVDDIDSAQQWVEELPAGRSRDRALVAYLQTRVEMREGYDNELAAQITDEYMRHMLDENVARWRLQQPTAEDLEWVRNCGLPAEVKKQLLSEAGH